MNIAQKHIYIIYLISGARVVEASARGMPRRIRRIELFAPKFIFRGSSAELKSRWGLHLNCQSL